LVTVRVLGTTTNKSKFAVQVRLFAYNETVLLLAHAPAQPVNVEVVSAVAVKANDRLADELGLYAVQVPVVKLASAVQLIAAGDEVIVPLPAPVALTISVVAAVAGVELNASNVAVRNDGNNALRIVGELEDKQVKFDSVVCRI